jgi:hypothetical protein
MPKDLPRRERLDSMAENHWVAPETVQPSMLEKGE